MIFTKNYFLLFFILSLFVFFQREIIFFRDYAIIWDGATRMINGEVLYKDFGVPFGPIPLLIPYYFMSFFGVSWLNFQIIQHIQNFLLLLNVVLLMRTLLEGNFVVNISSFIFVFFCLIFLTHPWYNTTALLFLFFALNASLISNKFSYFLSGIFAMFSVFSKQDFGFLSILMVQIIIVFDNYLINDSIKSALKGSFFFWLGLISSIFVLLYIYRFVEIGYWFALFQYNYESRLSKIYKIFINPLFYLSLSLFFFSIIKRERSIFVYSLILGVSSITSVVSGMPMSHFYYTFTIFPLIFYFMHSVHRSAGRILFLFFIIIAFIPALPRTVFIFENLLFDYYEHSSFNHRKIASEGLITDLGMCVGSMRNIYVPNSVCELIKDAKYTADSPNASFLNISELTFLPSELGYKNPKNHPLWYHYPVSVLDREKDLILSQIENGFFDLVFVQGIYAGGNTAFIEEIILSLRGNKLLYKEFDPLLTTPASISTIGSCPSCKILIFKRSKYGKLITKT
jgi:hypothetical protein